MIRSESSNSSTITVDDTLFLIHDDTYLPTNKQPPPSSRYQPPLYVLHNRYIVVRSFFVDSEVSVVCVGSSIQMQRHLIGSKSVQKRRKERINGSNGLKHSLRSSTIR